jgi:hypothetical protein
MVLQKGSIKMPSDSDGVGEKFVARRGSFWSFNLGNALTIAIMLAGMARAGAGAIADDTNKQRDIAANTAAIAEIHGWEITQQEIGAVWHDKLDAVLKDINGRLSHLEWDKVRNAPSAPDFTRHH